MDAEDHQDPYPERETKSRVEPTEEELEEYRWRERIEKRLKEIEKKLKELLDRKPRR